ncbi:NADH dehydrogenase 1 alpha subcomplex assembly factor 3 [Eumeta japonica]|uniref:NADH dehydrogenase 1 alpha subcomplex assembly factor 3 n=1 Tax=Eumeta variegata TaxID=151549 RepID=A0A4C1X580_EUMVA|nr:NADH dehydrogenase 1 alpha subcomplex assembly factor 3 [Eumeta japonica]
MLRRAVRPLRLLATGRAPATSVRSKSAYEGDGKTTVQVLNQDQELGLMVDSYATFGFRLNIGITVIGPMAIFPRTVMSWQVRGSNEVTEEAFRLFALLEPKIDLLGCQTGASKSKVAPPWLFKLFKDSCLYDRKEYEYGLRMDELSVKCLLYADEQVMLAACDLQIMITKRMTVKKKRYESIFQQD